jgi:hypothetical protein
MCNVGEAIDLALLGDKEKIGTRDPIVKNRQAADVTKLRARIRN